MICNFAPKSRVCSLIDKVPNTGRSGPYTADAVPTVTVLLPVERYARVTADEERVLSLHSLNRDQIV